MARLIVAALMVLLGMVLISSGFQEYVDGSCGAGACVFNRRLDDPLFVIAGVVSIAVGVLIFLNLFPLWMRKQPSGPEPLPPPVSKQQGKYPPRDGGGAASAMFLLAAQTDGPQWGTAILIALVIAALTAGVWWFRNRGKGAKNRK